MHTENFLDLTVYGPYACCVAKSSIALIEDKGHNGTVVTLKEKRPDGEQIALKCTNSYMELKMQINYFEKLTP
jgi:hypothetical protein